MMYASASFLSPQNCISLSLGVTAKRERNKILTFFRLNPRPFVPLDITSLKKLSHWMAVGQPTQSMKSCFPSIREYILSPFYVPGMR